MFLDIGILIIFVKSLVKVINQQYNNKNSQQRFGFTICNRIPHIYIKIVNYVHNTKYFNVEAKCKNLLAQQWNLKNVLAQEEFTTTC
jgi:hypothetical protein